MRRSAFTLIEALVAIVLIAVVLPIAMSTVTNSLRGAERSRTQDVSRRVASSRLARLVADGSWQSSATTGDCTVEDDGEDAVGYVWQLQLATWRDAAVHEITVRVGRGSTELPGAVAISTLVTEVASAP